MTGAPRITAGVRRAHDVSFVFDGARYTAPEGESLLAALLAAGVRDLRHAPADGAPRGGFCAMGVCQECLVEADGMRVEACRLPVREGLVAMRVRYAEDAP